MTTLKQIIHKEFMMDPDFEETLIKSVKEWLLQNQDKMIFELLGELEK